MTLAKYVLLLSLISSTVIAQQMSHPVMVSRDDAFSTARQLRIAADTIDILAVMVQFQQDNTPLTSGNGRFDLSLEVNPIIDAPPHNKQYFVDHLAFLGNYYRKSSKGKVVLRATVLDSIITLPGTMQDYSPPRTGSTIAVGNLARDAWQKVDSAGLVPDFFRYECFVVLHAGTGRDIDLVSLLGYDPTPYDIPSLYIGLNAFRQYYGSGYQGIPVNGGSFHITNSIVIPESESRLIPTVTGTSLLELSINGLLCASVGNYLGLPDLFDTNTGRSGIGRFGLMDGQAIFSFKGVFPPEPSAWEKYWLGWIAPITMQAGERTISLPAVSLPPADTVYRVPISAQEYFLVENRNRDPQRNGQKVFSTFRGGSRVQTFPRDTVGFNAFDIDSLAGVVTDVEDLDWSLPGGVDQNGIFFDGGVLIWHVDEAVIAQGLQTNGVNANPLRRGVDVEEADGSQDIGQQYEFLSPGSGSEEGTPLDFWYQGNGSPVNHNEFSQASHPDSRSNTGANSHITISEFSARGPKMTAKVKMGDAITILNGFPKATEPTAPSPSASLTAADLTGDGNPEIIFSADGITLPKLAPRNSPPMASGQGKMYAWKSDGSGIFPSSANNGLLALAERLTSFAWGPVVNDLNGDGVQDIVQIQFNGGGISPRPGSDVRSYTARDINGDGLADSLFSYYFPFRSFTAQPIVLDSLVLAASGVSCYLFNGQGALIDSIGGTVFSGLSRYPGSRRMVLVGADGKVIVATRNTTGTTQDRVAAISGTIEWPAVTGVVGRSPSDIRLAVGTRQGLIYLLDTTLTVVAGFPINIGEEVNSPLALGDIDGDGIRDIAVFAGNKLFAYNYAGASLDYFPITVPTSSLITSTPVIADVDGDGNVEVIAVSSDGLVVAFDKTGRLAPGFPLQAGTGHQSVAVFDVPSLSLSTADIALAVGSSDNGSISAWRTGSIRIPYDAGKERPWPQYQKDAQHSGLATEPLTGTALASEFFPKSRAYNWPNPVYNGKTFIRYFVKDNATVNIKVFDLAGDLVTTIPNPPGIGGVDNEVEWNATDVQSGVYFARIEANGAGGTGLAVVKIAIVK